MSTKNLIPIIILILETDLGGFMKKFSIIVLTYNSSKEGLLLTLESIIRQRFTDFEIIISDDSSDVDYCDLITVFFENNNFCDYCFIKNEKNLGTVDNYLNALKKANGKYIKGLGSGDLLYNSETINDLYFFMENHNAKFCFGNMMSYKINNPEFTVHFESFDAPKLLKPYNRKGHNDILRSMLIHQNWISGSTMVFEKNYLMSKLLAISGVVVYCEDLMQVLICLDKEELLEYPKNIVWYEFGEGISTSDNVNSKLFVDHSNFQKFLLNLYEKNKIVLKANKNLGLFNIKNPIIRKSIRLLRNPDLLFFKMKLKISHVFKKRTHTEIGFLDDKVFKELIAKLYKG